MKKLLLVILGVVLFAGTSYAQEFKPFKVGLGLGYAMPGGEGAGAGFLVYAEPMYRISDEIAVGLRLETALIARATLNADGTWGSPSASGLGSYTLNGQYYFNNSNFRPFVGAGMGLYNVTSVAVDATGNGGNGDVSASREAKFGFYPRVGFDAGHFNMQLEYNLVGGTTVEGMAGGEEMKINNSYLAFKIGFSISGGRR